MFMHGGVLHILGNMVFLWVFGDNVEDRLGHVGYLAFYLAAGVAATWTQVAIDMDSRTPLIGASGAIAGVLGAYLLLYPFNQVKTLVVFIFITVTRIPAMYLLAIWFALQFFSGIGSLTPAFGEGGVGVLGAHRGVRRGHAGHRRAEARGVARAGAAATAPACRFLEPALARLARRSAPAPRVASASCTNLSRACVDTAI
ncbi:MAG: rhomboid family intramembrane serine protease [Dehalococcoidia bacterium]|nr:rhomboid family intramembrane serine protease [Dehalococcoidia bacterium]